MKANHCFPQHIPSLIILSHNKKSKDIYAGGIVLIDILRKKQYTLNDSLAVGRELCNMTSTIDMSKLYVCGEPMSVEDGEFAIYVKVIAKDDRCVRVQRYQKYGAMNIGVKAYSLNAFRETYREANEQEIAYYFKVRREV